MRYTKLILAVICFLLVSCGTESTQDEWKGSWEGMGLHDSQILAMSFSNNMLFVGTNNGAYKGEVGKDIDWQEIGLNTATTEVTKIISWDSQNILASVRHDTIRQEDKVLFKSTDGGISWEGRPLELQDESNNYSYIYFLDYDSMNPTTLYGYSGYILRSNNMGQTWERIFTGGVSEFLYVSKDHPNQVWTGGWNNIFSPYLVKSEDGGETWTDLNEEIYFNTEANVYAAVIHPESEKTVLVGLGGSVGSANVIRKSKNGGENWSTVLEGYNIRSLKNSGLNPNRVYASGRSPQGQLFVAISEDYGDSWEIETFAQSPSGIQTTEMIVTEIENKETLFLATNRGVYSLTLEE